MIEVHVTGACKECPYLDPVWIVTGPYIDSSGKFHEPERKAECRHEKVCYLIRGELHRKARMSNGSVEVL